MRIAGIVLVVVALVVGVSAQDKPAPAPPKAPVVSDVQKLQVQTLAQAIEIAQLKAQAAQRDFDQAREALTKLVQALQVEGYELNLQTLTYTKKLEPRKPEKK